MNSRAVGSWNEAQCSPTALVEGYTVDYFQTLDRETKKITQFVMRTIKEHSELAVLESLRSPASKELNRAHALKQGGRKAANVKSCFEEQQGCTAQVGVVL